MGHSLGSTRIWGSWRLPLYPERPVQTAHCCPQNARMKGVMAFCLHDRAWSSLRKAIPSLARLTGTPAIAALMPDRGRGGAALLARPTPWGRAPTRKLASPTWPGADPRRACHEIDTNPRSLCTKCDIRNSLNMGVMFFGKRAFAAQIGMSRLQPPLTVPDSTDARARPVTPEAATKLHAGRSAQTAPEHPAWIDRGSLSLERRRPDRAERSPRSTDAPAERTQAGGRP